MDSRELKAFVKVVDRMSFTKAADDLGYAQSSVTAQIRKLEKEVGAQLFDRLPSGIRITWEGERLLPYARQILDLMAEANDRARSPETLQGTLVVGTMESIASFRLLPLVEHMHLRHPHLRLSMRPSLCGQTTDSIQRGIFDCGFFMDTREHFGNVMTEALTEEALVLVGNPNHPLARLPQIQIEDIVQHRVLGTEPGCAYRDGFEQMLSRGGGESLPLLEFGTIESIKRGVAGGLGIALLPKVACMRELAHGDLVALAWQTPLTVRTYFAWRKGPAATPAVTALLAAARRIVAEQEAELAG